MQGYILAFAMGVILLQQQAELPEAFWAGGLLPLAVFVFLLFRYQTALPAVIGRTLLVILFLGGGFFWAAALAQSRLADALPNGWEGRDIQLVGVVAELPQAHESGVRFAFDVEQVLT
jgi:competence protein ComEC